MYNTVVSTVPVSACYSRGWRYSLCLRSGHPASSDANTADSFLVQQGHGVWVQSVTQESRRARVLTALSFTEVISAPSLVTLRALQCTLLLPRDRTILYCSLVHDSQFVVRKLVSSCCFSLPCGWTCKRGVIMTIIRVIG